MKTVKEVTEFLRHEGVSGIMVKRIERMIGEFPTVEAFCAADKGALMKVFNKTTPESKHGLGDKFWPIFDKVLNYVRGTLEPVTPMFKCETVEVREEPEEKPADPRLVRLIPVAMLEKVLMFCQACDVEAINIAEVCGFLDVVKFRQDKSGDKPVDKPEGNMQQDPKEPTNG